MPHNSIDLVMARLDTVMEDFDYIARHGHAVYRTYKPEHLIEHTPRAQATCIYDHMVAEAERRFDGKNGVNMIEIHGLKLWVIGDHTAVRFKKMDEDGKSRNYPTKQAKAFDLMEQLDGLSPIPTRVSVGYVLDQTGTQIQRVQIARPNGKKVDWCAAILPIDVRQVGCNAWEDVTKQKRFGT